VGRRGDDQLPRGGAAEVEDVLAGSRLRGQGDASGLGDDAPVRPDESPFGARPCGTRRPRGPRGPCRPSRTRRPSRPGRLSVADGLAEMPRSAGGRAFRRGYRPPTDGRADGPNPPRPLQGYASGP
jgi:hypothetical protein